MESWHPLFFASLWRNLRSLSVSWAAMGLVTLMRRLLRRQVGLPRRGRGLLEDGGAVVEALDAGGPHGLEAPLDAVPIGLL